jgi:dethiobiotin synthetase
MNKKGKGFFITGTGTDVGKTYACRLLAGEFAKRTSVSYMKPVQTGCPELMNGSLLAPDFEVLKKSGILLTGEDELHVPYRFKPACSPHLAARLGRKKISLSHILACCNKIRMLPGMENGCVLVEGAGGVLVPLDDSTNMLHLMMHLGFPAIVVTVPSLGTLNHTFLTLCALHSANVSVAGVIINNREKSPEDFICRDNIKTIGRFIGTVPFLALKHGKSSNRKLKEFCDELAKKYL